MQQARNKSASRLQNSSGLAHRPGEILYIMQGGGGKDQIKLGVVERKRPTNVGHLENSIQTSRSLLSDRDHRFRKIEAHYRRAGSGKRKRVRTGTTTQIQNAPASQIANETLNSGSLDVV